jgi:hypothetical protein
LDAQATSVRLKARIRRRNDAGVHDAHEVTQMQVTAISTPRYPEWRWRITDYGGETVEESQRGFATIAAAVAAGRERLMSMSAIDRPDRMPLAWPARFGRR